MTSLTSSVRAVIAQPLECRVLLSAAIHHRTLFIVGTNGPDVIAADTDGSITTVNFNGSPQTFADSAYDRIDVDARKGDDAVTLGIRILKPSTIRGDNGNDTLIGGGGNDVLIAGLGNDSLEGGGTFEEPGGINTADYSDRKVPLTIPGDGTNTITAPGGEVDTLGKNLQTLLTGSGDDQLYVFSPSLGSTVYIDSGRGDDRVSLFAVGYAHDPTVHGGAGNDSIFLYAHGSTAHYFGDAGDDTFTVERSSETSRDFHGGAGTDTVDYTEFLSQYYPVTVTLDDTANDGSPTEWPRQDSPDNVHRDIERIIGTSGPDTLFGSSHNETLIGDGGADLIFGGGGADSLDGGGDNDLLVGQTGADTLNGGDGIDTLVGGPGANQFVSEPADTLLTQQVSLVNAFLVVEGNDSPNVISIGPKAGDPSAIVATIDGSTREFPRAQVANILLLGDGGANQLQIDPALQISSTIVGGDSADTITGGGGGSFNRTFGLAGNDSIVGGNDAGFDWINSGAGDDTVQGGTAREDISGDDGNDLLLGGDGADEIDGGSGNDTIDGQDDNDFLAGGLGDDTVEGGDGDDVLGYDGQYPQYFVWTQYGDDSMDGGEGFDRIADQSGHNTLRGGDGMDWIFGYADLMDGGDGDDTLDGYAQTLLGGGGNDLLKGFHFSSVLDGGDGNDTLLGQNPNDFFDTYGNDQTLIGGAGDDCLIGGWGNDSLAGGDGADTLDGEVGDDTLDGGPGPDTIYTAIGHDSLISDSDDTILRLPHVELDLSYGHGQLIVWGTELDDTIQFVLKPNYPETIQVIADGVVREFDRSAVNSISADGVGGSDFISVDPQITIFTILQDDYTTTPKNQLGNDTLLGGGGKDNIYCIGGNDSINGGAGDDYINVYQNGGNETLAGGDGNDCIIGGPGNDYIDGGPDDDTAFGEDGDDTLIGGPGNDTLDGGAGNNVIYQDFPPPMKTSPKAIALVAPELA